MAREGHHLGDDPRSIFVGLSGVEGSVCLVKQAHSSEDRDHQAAMRKIDIHRPIQWEGLGRGKQGLIGLQAVMCRRVGEASNEFVDVPNTLNGSQGGPIPNEQYDKPHASGNKAIYAYPLP